jgi:hypothetical protein
MLDNPHGAAHGAGFRVFPPIGVEVPTTNDRAPPAPVRIIARLGAMLAIALGFGLIAQALVSAHV